MNILDKSVKYIFPIRVENGLLAEEITSIKDLISKTIREIMAIPNLGRKSLRMIREFLCVNNLYLADDSMEKVLRDYHEFLFYKKGAEGTSGMKVYILCKIESHETEIIRVCATQELAQEFLCNLLKKDKSNYHAEYEIQIHKVIERLE